MPAIHIIAVAAMAAAFAFADRFAGGPYVTALRARALAAILQWPPWAHTLAAAALNARAVAWSTVALAVILAVAGSFTHYGPALAILALGFAAWRWTGWTTFGGAIDPKTDSQRLGLFERHMLAIPAFVLPVLVLRPGQLLPIAFALLLLCAFAFVATLLGVVLEAAERRGVDVNSTVEIIRGALLGAVLAVVLA